MIPNIASRYVCRNSIYLGHKDICGIISAVLRHEPMGKLLDKHTFESIEGLTEKQREVLHLASRFHSSKEIGQMLEISHHAVDKRLKLVLIQLSVQNRKQAAILYLQYEKQNQNGEKEGYAQDAYGTSDLPNVRTSGDKYPLPSEMSPLGDGVESFMLREPSATYGDIPERKPIDAPSVQALYNEVVGKGSLSFGQKILAAFAIMIGFIICLGMLIFAAERLSDVFYKVLT